MKPKPTSRRRFTSEEDLKLIELVEKHGKKWNIIAENLGNGLNERQCRERYTLCLDKNINKDPWTPEEDDLLRNLYKEHGRRWSLFRRFLNNRTDRDIKNRIVALQNREMKAGKIKLKNTKNPNNPPKSAKQQPQIPETEVKTIHTGQKDSNQFNQLISHKSESIFSGEESNESQPSHTNPIDKIINDFMTQSYYNFVALKHEFPYGF